MRDRTDAANERCDSSENRWAKALHRTRFGKTGRFRKTRYARAFALVEVTMSLSVLSLLGVLLLQLSINVLRPRQWSVNQAIADGYMTFERSYAQRIPFEQLASVTDSLAGSDWPMSPTIATSTVELGRLPGGRLVTGTVSRTRVADPLNFPRFGGTGTDQTNPAGMKTYRLQSVLTYRIGDRQYVKSRTVVRTQ